MAKEEQQRNESNADIVKPDDKGVFRELPLTLKYGYATRNSSSSAFTRSAIFTLSKKPKSSKREGFVR